MSLEEFECSGGVKRGLIRHGINPLCPALFSFCVDRAYGLPTSEFDIWCLDDTTLGSTVVESVLSDLANTISVMHQSGLAISAAKCELILLNHSQEEEQRTLNGFRELLLNVRLLKEGEDHLLEHEELQGMIERLKTIDSHPALVLKSCFAIPKLQCILRAWPPFKIWNSCNSLRRAVMDLSSVNFSADIWKQAALPVSLGLLGFGKRQTWLLLLLYPPVTPLRTLLSRCYRRLCPHRLLTIRPRQ